MSKSQSTLVFILILILLVFVGFLAWQLSAFHADYDRFVSTKQDDVIASKKLIDDVAALKVKLEEQNTKVAAFTEELSLPENLKAELMRDFVPQPEYVTATPLFEVKGFTEGALQVVGNLALLDAWQLRNKFFLDFIIQESVTFDFDAAKQKFVVTDLIASGIFYQMGLRKGDVILTLDGKAVVNSDELKVQLMQFTAAKLDVTRDGKKLSMTISYESKPAQAASTPEQAEEAPVDSAAAPEVPADANIPQH